MPTFHVTSHMSGWGGAGSQRGVDPAKAPKMTPEAEERAFQYCLKREKAKNVASRLRLEADELARQRPQRVPATFVEAASRCGLEGEALWASRTLADSAVKWEWVR
jgi:hypothetical protein